MLDFPNSPTTGQTFNQWRWDGGKWGPTGASPVTSVAAGTGLTASPSPIVATGTMSLTTPVSIANGGTNAVTASVALTNLGAAPLASPVFTGDPQAPTPATADNDTSIATTAFVKAQGYLPMVGGTLPGALALQAPS